MRLALLRDGLEDMDYLLMLQDKIAEAKKNPARAAWLKKARTVEAKIPQIIAGEKRGVATDFNGQLLEQTRREIADLLEE